MLSSSLTTKASQQSFCLSISLFGQRAATEAPSETGYANVIMYYVLSVPLLPSGWQ